MNTNKLIVITGVTRGIGRALAQEFIRQGQTLLGCGRNEAAIRALQQNFPVSQGHDFAVVDIADDNQVNAWATRLLNDKGVPQMLINNAAIINHNAPLWKISAQEFSDIVDINIKGTVNTIRYFVPPMVQRGQGVIVNFSSGWGRHTSPEVAPYCATKFAVEGLTGAFAAELPAGMAAVTLSPGVVDTDMLRSCMPGMADSTIKPDQWAVKAVPFLLQLSPQHNGQQLTI